MLRKLRTVLSPGYFCDGWRISIFLVLEPRSWDSHLDVVIDFDNHLGVMIDFDDHLDVVIDVADHFDIVIDVADHQDGIEDGSFLAV